jgi:hypothetical protein
MRVSRRAKPQAAGDWCQGWVLDLVDEVLFVEILPAVPVLVETATTASDRFFDRSD